MNVGEVEIEDDYITVKNTDTILSVAKAIADAGIPDAVVLDENDNVVGALDDFDIVSKVIAVEKDQNTVTAEEVMYAPPPVRKITTLEETHKIMKELDATMLPVVDDEKKLLGVVTIMDVLEGLSDEYQKLSFFGKLKLMFSR